MTTRLKTSELREAMKTTVPEGRIGNHAIVKFEVDEEEIKLFNLRQAIKHTGRVMFAGSYTKLVRNPCDGGWGETLVMSDTRDEIDDHLEVCRMASGHVLINGLGLGCVVQGCMAQPDVEKVTVVELHEDVINLVGPHLKGLYGDRLNIVHADAFEYKAPRGSKFGAVWHDIWDNICITNLDEMRKLHRKYGSRTQWQGSWAREMLE